MKKFFLISIIFFVTSTFMTLVFAGMAGEQGMKSYFAEVVQDRMNCVDANWVQHKINLMGAEELELNSIGTDIKFELSDSNDIEIEFADDFYNKPDARKEIFTRANKAIKLDVSEFVGDEQRLQFNFKSGKSFNLQIENVPMLIKIPKQIKKIKIVTVSGNIKISNLNLEEAKVDTISGDVLFKESELESLKLQSTSGDFKFSGKLGQVEITSVSGDVKFELEKSTSHAKIQTTSGDVKVELSQKFNFEIEFNTVSGVGKLNDDIRFTSGAELKTQGVSGEKMGLWKVQTVSGDFKIKENSNLKNKFSDEPQRDFTAKLNTENKIKKCSDFRVFGLNFK